MSKVLEQFNHRILEKEEETNLGRIIKNNKPSSKEYKEAFDELVKCNLKLVAKEATDYSQNTGTDKEDLIGEGCLGLLHAVEKYDPDASNGSRFATYATYWIQQKIKAYISSNTPVYIPSYLISGVMKRKNLMSEETLTRKDIQIKIGVDENILSLIEKATVETISLNAQGHQGHGSKEIYTKASSATLSDTLEDLDAKTPAENAIKNDRISIVRGELEKLSEMHRDIIISQYMEDEKIPLREIGVKYNFTSERIRQLRNQIKDELRRNPVLKRASRDWQEK